MSLVSKYYVTSLEDSMQSNTFRYALVKANENLFSEIIFLVSGTIKILSPLPKITKKVSINGTHISGYYNTPLIEIDFNNYCGLFLDKNANESEIIGLSLTNAKKAGIILQSNDNILDKNYIGLDVNGNAKGNENGILLINSQNNKIGLNIQHISNYSANVISGNKRNGIKLLSSANNRIVSNFIGTNIDGTKSLPNGENGILLCKNSNKNQIGGSVYTNSEGVTNNPTGDKGSVPIVYIFPPLGNLISGNKENGLYICKSHENILNGNFIGTDVNGTGAIANKKNGVLLFEANSNILRGCLVDENPFVYYNVCSGNLANGIQVTNSNNSIIQGNFFGIGASNADIVANGYNGILVNGTSNNTTVGGVIPLGNVCAGNKLNGIKVSDKASNFITFNTFGGLFAFQGAAPNGENGFYVDSIGEEIVARTNVFSGNLGNGIHLTGNSNNVLIEAVICGLVTIGDAPLPNGKNGLLISGKSNNNTIGSRVPSVIPRSAFSGNLGNGINITENAYNNQVNLSFVGLSVTGQDLGCGNKQNGILIDGCAKNNFIGTELPNPLIFTNYIAANEQYGVKLDGKATGNRIVGNYVDSTINEKLAKNLLGAISNSSTGRNIVRNNTVKIQESAIDNLAFYYFEESDQKGVVSPVDSSTILTIPYRNGWNGERYLLSTFDSSSNKYTPFKLKNIKELSFTVDLTNAQFSSSDNCNFNCYFVSSTSASNPNSSNAPINNPTYVPTANYYDAAAADGGRYGVEFDIFETNSGNSSNSINFNQHTGHFNSDLLDGTATQTGAQCITYSSSIAFNTQPTAPANGAPDKYYRTTYTNSNKTINVKVKFSDPTVTDETTITYNDVVVWSSKWLVGGTWSDWPSAPSQSGYPCTSIGTLVPFSNVTTQTATPNTKLTLETINNANTAGMWLFFGMNPYYIPPTGSYNANHSGANGANGGGGNVSIKNFTYSTW